MRKRSYCNWSYDIEIKQKLDNIRLKEDDYSIINNAVNKTQNADFYNSHCFIYEDLYKMLFVLKLYTGDVAITYKVSNRAIQQWIKEIGWSEILKEFRKVNKIFRKRKRTKTDEEIKEHRRKYCREYRKTERHKNYQKLYHQKYNGKYRRENIEKLRLKDRLGYQKNKERFKINYNKRRSLMNELPTSFSKKEWELCKDTFRDNKNEIHCAYCGKVIIRPTLEHFIPLSKGGELTINNVLPICRHCNSSKNDSDFFEWYPKQDFYSEERKQKILKYLGYKNKVQQLKLI